MYVARRGDEAGVSARQREFEELVAAIVEVEVEAPTGKAVGNLQVAYGQLTALTYTARQVNGRTLLDTKGGKTFLASVKRHRPLLLGLGLFAVALWLTAGEVWESMESVRPMLLSAVWGGLGSCVFLAKRISDRLAQMAYEDARMRGDVIRVFLGAMLGVVAVGLLFPEFDAGEVNLTGRFDSLAEQIHSVAENVAALDEGVVAPESPGGDETREPFGVAPATLAFLVGLSVRPFYAALESLSEALAKRFKAGNKERSG